jgi:hypothetical protein
MSRPLIGAVLFISCILGVSSAHAERYCLQGDQWGYPGNCSYATYHQCQASASGTRASCGVNPRYQHHRRGHAH